MAGQFDYGAGLALTHNSDITRGAITAGCANPPCAEWTEQFIGGFGYSERTVDLTARLSAQVERWTFLRNTYRNDTRYFLNGASVWTIAPQQLSWTAEDIATDSLLALTAPDTPANRVKTNSLSTGPEFTFRVNPTNTPVIGVRYGRYDIEGPGDNQRYTGYARWPYRFSALETLSLNYVATRVNFGSPSLYPDFLQQDQFLRYERISPLDSLTIEGGTTHVQRYGAEKTNGRLARIAALHALTSESAVRLLLAEQISDSATDLIRGVSNATTTTIPATPTEAAAAVPIAGPNVATADIYRGRRGELTFLGRSGRIAYTLQGYVRRVEYVTLRQQDYREGGGRLTLNWLRSDAVRLYAYTDYLKRTFPGLDERDTDRTSTLGVTYLLTPSLSVTAEGGRLERDSNIPLQSSLDRRVMLFLGYSTGPQYGPYRR